jgi:hypothetical protein
MDDLQPTLDLIAKKLAAQKQSLPEYKVPPVPADKTAPPKLNPGV